MMNIQFLNLKIIPKYLVFWIMGAVAVILCQTASKDWGVYSNHLYGYYSVHTSWEGMWHLFSFFKEPLYFFAAKFFGELLGFPVFIAVTTMIFITIKLEFLAKMVENVWVACFFYGCLYLFLFEGTVLRTAFATALIFPAFYYLQKQDITVSLALVLLATQIHLSTIVFLAMYPLYFFWQLNWLVISLFLLSPFMVLTDFSVYDLLFKIANIFTDKYQVYAIEKDLTKQNSTGLFLFFIGFFYMVISVAAWFLRDKILSSKFKITLLSLSMLGVVAMCFLHDHVAVAARFGELLLICLVPILGWLFLHFKNNGMKHCQYFLILTFLGYGFARFIYLFPSLMF